MTYTHYLNQKRYLCLDGLRCLSILAVIWHHAGYPYWDQLRLASQGFHGVTLFFVISGFLITSLLLKEKRNNGKIDLKQFYIRRTLRIFPLYYAVLLVYICLVLVLEPETRAGTAFLDNLKYFATYTSNVFVPFVAEERIIFFFAWSLAAEEQFYLIWPSIERMLAPSTSIPMLILIILASLILQYAGINGDHIYLRVLEVIAIPICIGVVLAHTLANKKSYQIISLVITRPESSIIFLTATITSLAIEGVPLILVYILMALLIASCVTCTRPMIYPLFENRLVKKIGQISYGMYLLHMLAYNLVAKCVAHFGIDYWPVTFSATIILTTLLGLSSFHLFEQHFLKMKRNFS
ncbi:acyltransferase family protein [Shewanella violacea]|uniref:Acyltransferase family protein n=1 Tax=Shewanella violacea (strain JCM 10179 / CIP 106290 / LMG 19151 / DSS12) TaxID=637905 RepID=D4ZIP0_SHEVD|nr:acyltransferase [Shewanella violacea]BAJ01539.1 acyltransferase family protein [Shewanella violacea DSS12]